MDKLPVCDICGRVVFDDDCLQCNDCGFTACVFCGYNDFIDHDSHGLAKNEDYCIDCAVNIGIVSVSQDYDDYMYDMHNGSRSLELYIRGLR